jgi:hypothetical protein
MTHREVKLFKIGTMMYLEEFMSWRLFGGESLDEDMSDILRYEPFLIVDHKAEESHVKILSATKCGWIFVPLGSISSFKEYTPQTARYIERMKSA